MDGGDLTHCGVVEFGSRLLAVPPLEQAHLVTVERRSWRERAGHGQIRIDGRDVGDCRFLEVEHGLVLAGVRDLEHSVLQQERLVALAAERRRGAADAEQVCRDPHGVFRRELRWRRVEDVIHGRTIVCGDAAPRPALSARSPAFKNPSFERKSSPFCGRSAGLRRSTFRRLIGGYGGTFCGNRAVATRRYT